jgi:hypothetical protein
MICTIGYGVILFYTNLEVVRWRIGNETDLKLDHMTFQLC